MRTEGFSHGYPLHIATQNTNIPAIYPSASHRLLLHWLGEVNMQGRPDVQQASGGKNGKRATASCTLPRLLQWVAQKTPLLTSGY